MAIFACTVISAPGVFAQEESPETAPDADLPSAAELQEKLRQWVETQRLISEEQIDWEAQKQSLSDLNALRQQEVAQLDELIEAAGTRLSDAETRREELNVEEGKLREQRDTWEKSIGELEAAARELLPKFPAPLKKQLSSAIKNLEAGPQADTPLQNRYRDVLAVLIEAQAFDSRLTLETQMREFGGETVEVEVLYLGLARAYYTDRSGKHAGMGQPGQDGWQWSQQGGLASSIRRTIDIFQKRVTPQLVELPQQVVPNP